MLSWMWPDYTLPDDLTKDDNRPNYKFPDDFARLLEERGVTIRSPCAQTLLFSGKNDSCIYSMRICPVWTSENKDMDNPIIRSKRMEFTVSNDRSMFTDWLSRYGVTAVFNRNERSLILSFPPVRSRNAVSNKWEHTTTKLTVKTQLIERPVKIWILAWNQSVETKEVGAGKIE